MTRILAHTNMPKHFHGIRPFPAFSWGCRFKALTGLFGSQKYYDKDIRSLAEHQQVIDGRKKIATFSVEFTNGGKVVFEETDKTKIKLLRQIIIRNTLLDVAA